MLDLTAPVDVAREGVRNKVIADWFTAHEDEDAPGGVWFPSGTPEAAELAVFKAWGCWWATWRKLDVPAEAPEDERWERLRIEAHPNHPGILSYLEF